MKPVIAITIGDFNGIGPEVAIRAALHSTVKRICQPLLVGPLNVFEHTRRALKIRGTLTKSGLPVLTTKGVPVVDVGDGIWPDVQFGKVTRAGGKNAGMAIEKAVELCVKRQAQAMVTAPVSKKALHLAGYDFPGQTEMVALLSGSQRVAMMLISPAMRVGLVTIHTPLKNVAGSLSREKIIEKADIVVDALRRTLKIRSPRLAVLGVNPHAGEDGHLGTEEQEMISPAITELQRGGIHAEGPFPADAFFGQQKHKEYDAVLAMYHDQGLIPLKLTSMGRAVNFSAGLRIIRTSPDHGTAHDIAGKGKADISSMIEAIKLAVQFSKSHDA